jgi:hypothetical protein
MWQLEEKGSEQREQEYKKTYEGSEDPVREDQQELGGRQIDKTHGRSGKGRWR